MRIAIIALALLAPGATAQRVPSDQFRTSTTNDPAKGTADARRWQVVCVAHVADWEKEAGSILLMDPGPPCREAFGYGDTDAARIAEYKRRGVLEGQEALARFQANLARLQARVDRSAAPPPSPSIVPPHLLSTPSPEHYYPKAARKAGQEGRTVLACKVKRSGRINACRVAESSGVAALDEAAIKLARDQTWQPALQNGAPIDQEVKLPVRWALY